MSRKGFLTLVAATALAVIMAIGLVVSAELSAVNPQPGGDPMFQALIDGADDLRSVVIETPRYQLRLEYRDGRWFAVDRGDYPVRADPIVGIVASLAGMTIVEQKTDNPAWYTFVDVAGVGLPGSQSVRVAVFAADGRSLADAIFGAPSESIGFARAGGTFVRRSDEAQTWLVEGAVAVPAFVQEWFDPILNVPGPDVARTTILVGGEVLLDARKVDFATGDYELTFLSPAIGPDGATANDNGMRSVAQAIVTTAFDDARPRETVTFPPDTRTVRFETRAGLHLEVAVGEAGGETWVVYTATADPGAEAAQQALDITARTERWAFKLPAHRIAALNRPFAELFDPPAPPAGAPGAIPIPFR